MTVSKKLTLDLGCRVLCLMTVGTWSNTHDPYEDKVVEIELKLNLSYM